MHDLRFFITDVRPSLLMLKSEELKDRIRVSVGGRVIPIAEGYWYK